MFSSDLAYASRFDEDNWGSPPSYLSLNNPVIQHPWKLSTDTDSLHMDFILIAEFSELEGPKPVITIPKDGAGLFDISEFAVRIMSVDQATAVSGGFQMTEDSQVILSEKSKCVYAFVHHFVLFDKQARGYVRPFAVSYVTNDQRKLMCCYEELSSHLKKVARYFKYGNRMVFKNEVDRYLMDLEYTKAQELPHYRTVLNNTQANTGVTEKELLQNLKTLESVITEVKTILDTICATMTDKRLEQRFARLEENFKVKTDQQKQKSDLANSLRDLEGPDIPLTQICGLYGAGKENESLMFFNSHNYKPKRIQITGSRKFDLHLRGLHELCSWGFKDGIQKLKEMHRHFQQDLCVLEVERVETYSLDPLSGVLMFGTSFVACNFMNDVDKLCVGSCCSIQRSRAIPNRQLSRWSSNDTLESYKSAASSFRSLPDMEDSESLVSVSSIDGSFSSYSGKDFRRSSEDGLESVQTSDTEATSFSSDFSFISRQDGSLSSIDKTLLNENPESLFSKLHSASNPNATSLNKSPINNIPLVHGRNLLHLESSTTEPVENPACRGCKVVQCNVGCPGQTMCTCSWSSGETVTPSADIEDFKLNADGSAGSAKKEHLDTPSESKQGKCDIRNGCPMNTEGLGCQEDFEQLSLQHQSSHLSFKDPSDSTNQQVDESNTDSSPAFCSPMKVTGSLSTSKESLNSAQGIYKLLNNYNNMHHVIYSLLTGRPVIVIATASFEKDVKEIVRALQHFLPNNPRCPGGANPNCCLTWLSHIPKITDLGGMKLVGVCRPEKKPMDRFITPAFKRFVTILDVDRRLLLSPMYQGSFLTLLISKKKSFKFESDALLAYVKGLLSEISSKAFIFFHLFCLGGAGTYASGYSLHARSKSFQQTVVAFLTRLGALDSDAVIIQYLAEVIKHQHIENHYYTTSNTGVPVRPLLLRNQNCQTFKC
ncbi:guanine nucleotide exchange protein smcr8a-like [Mizuhopecten yessoensis]|uniref:Smith-Magenis syndrome chromosomal region candidate gene 8 protein n=1 Tax=Mizuhopecten yessoensis TaxID=6573 RepID=A0A210PM62_MIZYE|nr:guanine nucleotide exchange protein smcr8a-like [Mizuhopecten yessoensis]XP_021380026.1 guanine nucleotide exchange protein smcr8a-like [Mizuhopecten yessoensis]OWF37554.1 Smith-Magenis syndrome chromosomal region candidate gene 8 protein [Mizuhopecten yessoensis]